MRAVEKLVSLAAIAVMFGGLTYAYERESLLHTDLNPVFQDINQNYFDGSLSGVRVEWSRLPDDEQGEARKLGERDHQILIDRRENTSIADVRRTLEHEACHISVDWKEAEEHGPVFQNCMLRFPSGR